MVSLLMKIVKIKRHLKKFPIDGTMISWYYSVVDIIAALTDSPTPRQYWGKVKEREFVQLQLSPIWVQLKLPAQDGKMRQTDCVNTKGALRLIQSIPDKKAEPFKRWLAQVGQDRLDEIENPELAQQRIAYISKFDLDFFVKIWYNQSANTS